MRHHTVRSEGNTIAYQVLGEGPAVVLANGLGGEITAWRYVIEALGPTRKIICWDYRGLFRSPRPLPGAGLSPVDQARDLGPILAAEGVDRFAIFGWSMGVQVGIEVCRAFGSRVLALGAINGVAGRPFDTALASRFSRHIVPALVRQVRRSSGIAGSLTRLIVRWPALLPTLQQLRLVGRAMDPEIFHEVARNFGRMDFDTYYATLEALGEHDAWSFLRHITVPTSIITGDHDFLTPADVARRMAREIAGARLVVLPGGTHYTPVEFPVAIGEEVRALCERVGI